MNAEPEDTSPVEVESNIVPCRMLRTKTAFGSFIGDYHSWESGDSTTAAYWCLQTMGSAGPDEDYAHPRKCCSGRTCYAAPLE